LINPAPYTIGGATSKPSTQSGEFNGHLSVYVVNELTTPNSTANNDIEVTVFVSACDDFEVAEPTEMFIENLSLYPVPVTTQGGMEEDSQKLTQADGDRDVLEDKPQAKPSMGYMAPSLDIADRSLDVYYADPVTSFRQILKRYNYYATFTPEASGQYILKVTMPNFPLARGYRSNGFFNAATPADPTPYNFVKMTLLNYVSYGFVAYRGGIRYKVLASGARERMNLFQVNRKPSETTFNPAVETLGITTLAGGNSNQRAAEFMGHLETGLNAQHATAGKMNPVLEYELPFYDRRRFYPARQIDNFGTNELKAYHSVAWQVDSAATDTPNLSYYVSVGEDFTLGMFLNSPVFYKYTNPAPSTTTPP
jgi:hypothetical protein